MLPLLWNTCDLRSTYKIIVAFHDLHRSGLTVSFYMYVTHTMILQTYTPIRNQSKFRCS
jgi:hypothetical protein